ncbi:MAG TPA: phosphatase PAP2 family protein [Solimonas sp.]|nr:phosphatase PAP2 family protein [Solimonas sp.]
MSRTPLIAAVLVAASLHAMPAAAETSGSELAADIITGVVPLSGPLITYLKDDDEGRLQWLWSTGVTLGINSVARYALGSTSWGIRPNGHKYGFPSGHVGFVVSGAAFLSERYGWRYGVPAYLASGYVAWERVKDRKHRWRDVLVGGGLAWTVSHFLVTPFETDPNNPDNKQVSFAPIVDDGFYGLNMEYQW